MAHGPFSAAVLVLSGALGSALVIGLPLRLAQGAPTAAVSPAAEAQRLEEQARRADTEITEAKTRAVAFRAVARLARTHLDSLKGSDRIDAERGLGQLDEQVHWLDVSVGTNEKRALELRASADRLRGNAASGVAAPATVSAKENPNEAASCLVPYSFDADGHKRWRPECL